MREQILRTDIGSTRPPFPARTIRLPPDLTPKALDRASLQHHAETAAILASAHRENLGHSIANPEKYEFAGGMPFNSQ